MLRRARENSVHAHAQHSASACTPSCQWVESGDESPFGIERVLKHLRVTHTHGLVIPVCQLLFLTWAFAWAWGRGIRPCVIEEVAMPCTQEGARQVKR